MQDWPALLADHENQTALWKQMLKFRHEYGEMRSEVESALANLHMDFTSIAREASCNFVLLLSQMGCPSCTTGVRIISVCLFPPLSFLWSCSHSIRLLILTEIVLI